MLQREDSQRPAPLDAPCLTRTGYKSCKPTNQVEFAYGKAAEALNVSFRQQGCPNWRPCNAGRLAATGFSWHVVSHIKHDTWSRACCCCMSKVDPVVGIIIGATLTHSTVGVAAPGVTAAIFSNPRGYGACGAAVAGFLAATELLSIAVEDFAPDPQYALADAIGGELWVLL